MSMSDHVLEKVKMADRRLLYMFVALFVIILSSGSAFAAAQDDDTASVNVAHFAPFGADVEGTSVTIKVMGKGVDAALEDVKFRLAHFGKIRAAGFEPHSISEYARLVESL